MKTTKSELPMYRLTFSRITGQDADGRDILARPKEIGAVWARKGGKPGGIVALDIIPVELAQRARRQCCRGWRPSQQEPFQAQEQSRGGGPGT